MSRHNFIFLLGLVSVLLGSEGLFVLTVGGGGLACLQEPQGADGDRDCR